MANSIELVCAIQASKYAAREVLGVIRTIPSSVELLKLLNQQMIIQVLSDASCLEAFTEDEIITLNGSLILHV